jgi:hypothetical protein
MSPLVAKASLFSAGEKIAVVSQLVATNCNVHVRYRHVVDCDLNSKSTAVAALAGSRHPSFRQAHAVLNTS